MYHGKNTLQPANVQIGLLTRPICALQRAAVFLSTKPAGFVDSVKPALFRLWKRAGFLFPVWRIQEETFDGTKWNKKYSNFTENDKFN